MKYTFSNKPLAGAPKKAVRVRFIETGETRFVEKADGTEELQISVGKHSELTRRKFILACRKVIRLAKQHKLSILAIELSATPFPKLFGTSDEEICSLIAQNFEMAAFEFTTFKSKPKQGWFSVKEAVVCGKTSPAQKRAFRRGQLIGEHVNICRELANTPGGDMTPSVLATDAKKLLKGTGVRLTVLGKKEMRKLKMGGILGVAQGSAEEPKFIIAEYNGGKKGEGPIVLVGKGVTFDTGGINLKPGDSATGMHMDMSGGAAVLAAVALAAKLKVPRNVVALVGAVENMTSGSSYRPGDVLKSMSGMTIEVLNTDAEGRVSLADSLHYAKKYNPMLVVDVATLTGSSMAALGQQASAVFSNRDALLPHLATWGEESGDYVWPLPLWSEYEELVKGKRGDWANIASSGNSRYGDVANAAAFLHQFIKPLPWVHLDIAPRMESTQSDNLASGATGEPVRLLVKILETFKPSHAS